MPLFSSKAIVHSQSATPLSFSSVDQQYGGGTLTGFIASSDSLMVATGGNLVTQSEIVTSSDGTTWTSRTSPVGNSFLGPIVTNGTTWIASRQIVSSVIETTDPTSTWTNRAFGFSLSANYLYYDPVLDIFLAGGALGGSAGLGTSPDGITWTNRTLTGVPTAVGAIWRAGSVLLVFAYDGSNAYFYSSTDGISWGSPVQVATGASRIVFGGVYDQILGRHYIVTTVELGFIPNDMSGLPETSDFTEIGTNASSNLSSVPVLDQPRGAIVFYESIGGDIVFSNDFVGVNTIVVSSSGLVGQIIKAFDGDYYIAADGRVWRAVR